MKTRTLILAAAIISLPIAGVAAAGYGMKHHVQERFAAMDTDGNGKITKAEDQARGEARFKAADTNSDGKLSPAEMEAAMLAKIAKHMSKRVAKHVKRMDTDGDGMVSQAEAQASSDARFVKMDANKDGVLEASEISFKRGHHRGPREHGKMRKFGERHGHDEMHKHGDMHPHGDMHKDDAPKQ